MITPINISFEFLIDERTFRREQVARFCAAETPEQRKEVMADMGIVPFNDDRPADSLYYDDCAGD